MAGLLELRELTVELPTSAGWVRPVNGVTLTLDEGETLGIVGESGSGKTMLSLALMGLTPPGARRSGEAWLAGRSNNDKDANHDTGNGAGGGARDGGRTRNGNGVAADTAASRRNLLTASAAEMRSVRGGEIGMIFQEPMTALNPVMRIGAQIEEAIRVHRPGAARAAIAKRALDSMLRAAIPNASTRAYQYPHQLSGGLRQRAMIAMALAPGPRLLIADEPTTALDVTVQKQILDVLVELRRDLRLGMLFITHDLGVVAQVADRAAVMYAGRVVEEGFTGDVLRRPQHPYTQGLLRAAPRLERGQLTPIPGTVPPLDRLPAGCAFGPRCEYHRAECDAAVPELRAASATHRARCILVPRT
jgi:peptide/nickel transport system ATP-binding protein